MRLIPIYVGYFAAFGISIPFFPSYLRALGLSGPEVALVLGVGPLFHLGVPLAWGWLADRLRRPDWLLRLACAGACLALLPLVWARDLPAVLASYALHQLFAVPILALLDSLALAEVRRSGGEYARLRLWGSASFLVICSGAGYLFTLRERTDAEPLVPLMMSAGYGLAALAALRIRSDPADRPPRPHLGDLRALLASRRFLFILILAPLHWATLAPYHAYLGILALERGFPPATVGHAFAVSVVAEILAFYFFRRLAGRASLAALLAIASLATAARWLLVARSTSAGALIALQSLHALSFGVFWGAAMAWVASCVPPALRATGQALFTTVVFGLGNLVGYAGAGLLYDPKGAASGGGGPAPAFVAAGFVALIPFALAVAAATWSSAGHQRRDPAPP